MTNASKHRIALALSALLCAGSAAAQTVLLSGAVRSTDAESVYTPMSESSPVVLRYLVPDGTVVKPGDVLVRIDPGAAQSQITSLKAQIALAKARIDKEVAELDVLRIDAELAFVDAVAALAKGNVDAAIPADYVARIDYDRYQGEQQRAQREHALKQREREAATEAVSRRRRDGALEIDQLIADLRFAEHQISRAEQRATRGGTVIFGFHPWSGQRYQEGLSANPGGVIGEVIGAGALAVRAYALDVDRPGLKTGQAVDVSFDALPGRTVKGRIEAISGAPEPKAEWGRGRYFVVDVALPAEPGVPLRPGMSARLEVSLAAGTGAGP